MNDPQLWGAIRGVLIALGGAVAGFGLMSAAQWIEIVNQVTAVGIAVTGLIAIALPMWRGWRSRSTKGTIEAAAALPEVRRVIADPDVANAVTSGKVVGPSG